MMRRFSWVLALLATACAQQQDSQTALCGSAGRLRVGVVGAEEGRTRSSATLLSDQDQFRLRELLTVSSRCEVQLEPVLSPEQARMRLKNREWDLAFLPPGLTAFALDQDGTYGLVRQLGRRQNSRSQLLVRRESRYRSRADLRGQRIGLLPRGSLTGFYLPLFNLHGLNFSQVRYALSYADLLNLLRSGEVDVIAWDGALPLGDVDARVVYEDAHAIPLGAMAISQSLLQSNYQNFLAQLDQNVSQLPATLGYSTGVIPELQSLQELSAIVANVESWSLPRTGEPYAVYGKKNTSVTGGEG